MVPSVLQVKPLADHLLEIVYSNGEVASLDLKPFLDFGIFQRLKDPAAFNQVRVAFGTLEWPCGADLDPEFVYKKSEKVAART